MKPSYFVVLAMAAGCALGAPVAAQNVTGPSTLQSPYMISAIPSSGVVFYSVASNGNGVSAPNETYPRLGGGAPYRLVGTPDGLGLFRTAQDILNGTFTVICNHELGATSGVVRDHGSTGAFVSQWTVRTNPGAANHLEVIGGRDLIQQVKLWSTATSSYATYNSATPMPSGFARFCSGDTGAVTAYRFGALGTDDRIHLNGEENGDNGRAFAHIATGAEAGTTFELPRLGDYSFENAVVCPQAQEKTIVVGTDDSTPGQVYVYVGTKQAAGNTVERAGLTNGGLYGVAVAGVTIDGSGRPVEDRVNGLGTAASGPVFSKPFTLADLGDVSSTSGAQLNTQSHAAGVVNWLRPEDGCWDKADSSRFYFATTDSFGGNSRLWLLDFSDISQPELGGTVTMLFDGSSPSTLAGGIVSAGATDVRMMDNIGATGNNQVLIQEDVGNNARLGRLWMYDIAADRITEIGTSDPARFLSGSPNLTQDEETSGIIDASDIIGPGWFMLVMQAHYSISGELVQGGQLMSVYIPQAVPGYCAANCDGSSVAPVLNVNDFLCFLNRYAAGDPLANCDGSVVPPVLNVNDFACFLNAYAAGCP